MSASRLFTAHPRSVGETYLEHMGSAFWFTGRLFVATLCCLIHAVFPFMFKGTGSRIITDLHDRMVINRAKRG